MLRALTQAVWPRRRTFARSSARLSPCMVLLLTISCSNTLKISPDTRLCTPRARSLAHALTARQGDILRSVDGIDVLGMKVVSSVLASPRVRAYLRAPSNGHDDACCRCLAAPPAHRSCLHMRALATRGQTGRTRPKSCCWVIWGPNAAWVCCGMCMTRHILCH